MPKQLSNSRFLYSNAHNYGQNEPKKSSFGMYARRHTRTGKYLGVLSSAHDLMDKAHRAHQYEEMLKFNRLTSKSWLSRIELVGHRLVLFDYQQHVLISSSWPMLILFVTLLTIFFLLVFTVLFFYVEKEVCKDLYDAWNLSIQTFLTIGYGSISPQTDFGNVLVYFEVTLSTAICSIFTGLVFLKFSKPKAPILFSHKAVINNNSDGQPILKFRFCLSVNGAMLLLPKYEMNLIMVEESYEGTRMIRLRKLKLHSSGSVVLNANFNLVHDLDTCSPLRKHWVAICNAKKKGIKVTPAMLSFALLVTVEGVEATFQSNVLHQHFIYPHDIAFEMDYDDMMKPNLGRRGGIQMEVLKLFDLIPSKYPLLDDDVKMIRNLIADSHVDCKHVHRAERKSVVDELKEIKSLDKAEEDALLEVLNSGKRSDRKIIKMKEKRCNYCFRSTGDTPGKRGEVHIVSGSCLDIACHCSTYYWYSLKSSFSFVICLMFLLYGILTCLFALFVMLDTSNPFALEYIENRNSENCTLISAIPSKKPIEFSTAFYFATQTLSSVGYGVLSPTTTHSHIAVTLLGYVGFLVISAISGIIWSRFAKAKIPLKFSKNAVITNWNGERVLMLRIAGMFPNRPIAKLTLTGSAILKVPGLNYMKAFPLNFVRDTNPLFKMPGTWMHVIDKTSPLYQIRTKSMLNEQNAVFLMFVAEGYDTAFETSVYKAFRYVKKEIKHDYHFKDIMSFHDHMIHVNMKEFDVIQKDACSFATYFLVKSYFLREKRRIRLNKKNIALPVKNDSTASTITTNKSIELSNVNVHLMGNSE